MSCLIRDRFARENPCFMQISPCSLRVINYSLGRVRLWAVQRDIRIYERRERARPPLLSIGTICRSRRRKYDQMFATNKARGDG